MKKKNKVKVFEMSFIYSWHVFRGVKLILDKYLNKNWSVVKKFLVSIEIKLVSIKRGVTDLEFCD